MRRTLVSFELKACEWEQRATSIPLLGSAVVDAAAAGIAAYAYKQADIQRGLVKVFTDDWHEILEAQSLATSWLHKYPRPPEKRRHRLVNNVQLYHSPSTDPHVDTLDNTEISPTGFDAGRSSSYCDD